MGLFPLPVTNSYIPYLFSSKTVPAKFSLQTFGPPLGMPAGTVAECTTRTLYRLLMTTRAAYGLPFMELSSEFVIGARIAADYSTPPPSGDQAWKSLVTYSGASVLKTKGVCRRSIWSGGPAIPSVAQYTDAVNYKVIEAYRCDKSGDPIAVAKEILCGGMAVSGEGDPPRFPFNGGGNLILPASTDTSRGVGHAITYDAYDDDMTWDGAGGVGAFHYVTNGVGQGWLSYAYARRYLKTVTAVRVVAEPVTYPFPPPEPPPIIVPPPLTGNAMIRDQIISTATAWDTTKPETAQATKDALSTLVAQIIVPSVTPPPVVVATASNAASGYPPLNVLNGDRRASWWSAKSFPMPQWLEINFGAPRTISKVTVYSVQDSFSSPVEPTEDTVFNLFGLQDFQIESNGVVLATVTGNNKVKKVVNIVPTTTDRIRIIVTKTPDNNARIVEVEVA